MNCTVCGKFLNWGTTTISEPICSECREVRRLNYSSVDAMRDEIAALRERLATAERRIEYLDAFLTAPPAPATPPASEEAREQVRLDVSEEDYEVVAHGVDLVHLERMTDDTIWGRLYLHGGGTVELAFWAESGKVLAKAEHLAALDGAEAPAKE